MAAIGRDLIASSSWRLKTSASLYARPLMSKEEDLLASKTGRV
jgi:hypothetical protein